MQHYSIQHTTQCTYQYPVSASHHAVYLEPANLPYQQCESFQLTTHPQCLNYRRRTDYFGNTLGLFSIQSDHQVLSITSNSVVSVAKEKPDIATLPMSCAEVIHAFESNQTPVDVTQYLYGSSCIPSDPHAEIREYAQAIFLPDKSFAQCCAELMESIKTNFKFDPKATDINTPVEEFFKIRRGVCQDFAHFAITAIVAAGLPARYMSGYILTAPPPGKPRLEGADASHAWVSVYIPEYGWLDFDPTNNLFCSDQHVTVAWGRDFNDVSLVRGAIIGGGSHEVDVAVTMKPLGE